MYKFRRILIQSIPVLIGCLILALMIWKISPGELKTSLSTPAPYALLGVFFVFFIQLYALRTWRWLLLFKKAKPIDACKVLFIGLAINQIAPMGVGDVARAFVARKGTGISIGETLSATIVERILDITFLVASFMLFLGTLTQGNKYLWQLIAPLSFLIIGYGLLFRPYYLNIFEPLIKKIKQSKVFPHRIKDSANFLSLDTFKNAMLEFRDGKVLLVPVLLTICSWGLDVLAHYLLLSAFGVNIPVLYIVSLIGASWIVGLISFLPGGLGAKDVSFAFLLSTLGVSLSTGISISLIWRAITYIQVGAGSTLSLLSFAKSNKPASQ